MKLSIIIPVYNEINCLEKFTNNLMDSFNNQNAEYIFINDGSTDGSAEWLINYKSKYLSNLEESKFINLYILSIMSSIYVKLRA